MFGKSIFQSVLDRLEAEETTEDAGDGTLVHAGIRGLNAGFALDTAQAAGRGTVRQAYADMADADSWSVIAHPAPARPAPKSAASPDPVHLNRTTPAQIAEDLGLSATETPASLAEKRRLFAAANHPDRHSQEHRAAATIRMTIANTLIDDALRGIRDGRASKPPRHRPDDRTTTRQP